MDGPAKVLVTKSSATNCRPWESGPEHVCAISRTHTDMVRYGAHDDEYDKVLERLTRITHQAIQRGPRDIDEEFTRTHPQMSAPENAAKEPIVPDATCR